VSGVADDRGAAQDLASGSRRQVILTEVDPGGTDRESDVDAIVYDQRNA
jgi:hypothetical protein